MKKTLVLIFAVLFTIVSLTGTNVSAQESYNIYLITMDQMDQYWMELNEGCQKAVAELGNVNFTWLAPDVKDDAKQIESINNAVAGGADAILLAANGPTAVTSALEEAQSAGVKIVYVDSPADFPAVQTLATDNKAAGFLGGEKLIEALSAKNLRSGSIGIVNNNASTTSTVDREAGFREALEGSDFTILETQYCDGDAVKGKDVAANFITQGVVGIFSPGEGGTIGTANAIKEDGSELICVSFGQSNAIFDLILDGSIYSTIAQNPKLMGEEGIKVAVEALKGNDPVETYIDTGAYVIDKAYLEENATK